MEKENLKNIDLLGLGTLIKSNDPDRVSAVYEVIVDCLLVSAPSDFIYQLREMYCEALNKDLTKTPEYKECRLLLGFMAKDQLLQKINKLVEYSNTEAPDIKRKLVGFKSDIESAGIVSVKSPIKSPRKSLLIKNRSELKQKVAEMARTDKTAFETARDSFLDEVFWKILPSKIQPFTNKPLWEVITLKESEARFRVVPRIRAPIHTALNNPACYLLCDCCKIKDSGDILPTMPDICIAYKLHLECGNLINLYDWLLSFNSILNPDSDEIDPKVQVRFTQAVSELEFLGFIKPSKRKKDHVMRLTWGGHGKS